VPFSSALPVSRRFFPRAWVASAICLGVVGVAAAHAEQREIVLWDATECLVRVEGAPPARSRFSPARDGLREAEIDLGDAGRWNVSLRSSVETDGLVRVETAATLSGPAKAGATLERLSVRVPLALERRKRVVQAGENGLTWETRSAYQFHSEESAQALMAEPDTNLWTLFRSDWRTGDTYVLSRWESARTAPLIQHRGTGFPGWLAIYDRKGGVAAAVDESKFRIPLSLEANTEGGGCVTFDLKPPTEERLPLSGLGDAPLRLHAVWKLKTFSGENAAETGASLARRTESPKKTEPVAVRPSSALPVFGGVPLAAGLLRAEEPVELRNAAGARVPVQTAPLAFWPDGSVKWLETVFFDPGEKAVAPTKRGPVATGPTLADFRLTYGDGGAALFSINKAQSGVTGGDRLALKATRSESGEVRIDTGRIVATLGAGRTWWKSLKLGGRSVLKEREPVEAWLEMAETHDAPEPGGRIGASGAARERSRLVAETIELEEAGPLRAVVRIDGYTDGRWPCHVTMRLEFFANSSAIRGHHTLELGDFDVRNVFIEGFGLRVPLATGRERARMTTLASTPVVTDAAQGALVRALHPDLSEVRVGVDGASREAAVTSDVTGMVAITGSSGAGIVAGIRDFRNLFPTQIAVSPSGETLALELDFWPRGAGPMDFRRYSDLPHRAQGETVTTGKNDWVEEVYYREEPVRGISRTHEFLLQPGAGVEELPALDAALNDRGLLYAGEAAYVKAGALAEDLSDERFAPARETLERFADFLEFHRRRWRWSGKWIHGDIQHSFMRAYGRIVKPAALAELLASGWGPPAGWAGPVTKIPLTKAMTTRDYAIANDWAWDNGRWGWTNTEGLPNRYLSELYLRTGRRDVFFTMEALARQSRDVVTRHSGRWFGAGTRHGVQPWSDGCHQERQTILSEYRVHRLLTGEKRSRDVLLKLGYDVYLRPKSRFVQGFTPMVRDSVDHSTRLYGLIALWEATGDPKVGDALTRYVRHFISPDGIVVEPTVRFPEIESVAPPRGLNSGTMFFHSFGGMHALVEYHALTGDAALRKALTRMAAAALDREESRRILEGAELHSKNAFWLVLAFAAKHGGEQAERFREFLEGWLREEGATALHQVVARNRDHWTGPTAFVHTNLPESLFWLNAMPAVVDAVGAVPPVGPAALAKLEKKERDGERRFAGPVSWQDEYDRPEFEEHLGRWLPWAKGVSE